MAENNIYEKNYMSNILQINKTLRNKIEIIYKLLRQKLIIEKKEDDNNKHQIKLNNLINQLENSIINFTKQIESHSDIINSLKTIEEKFASIQKNEKLLIEINNLQNRIKILNNQNTDYKSQLNKIIKDNELNKKGIANLKQTNEFLNKENIDLRLQIDRSIMEKKNFQEIISQVEGMSSKLKDVEKVYKDKLKQKDAIISQLDIQLQQYELQIKQLQKQLLLINQQNKNIIEKNTIMENKVIDKKNIMEKKEIDEKKEITKKEENTYRSGGYLINTSGNDINENKSEEEDLEDDENVDDLLKQVDEEINKSI